MFSVVIPLYNKEISIKNTIQSVLDQTFQNFEIVIINDGSTDRSVEIVNGIQDSRIRLVNQRNSGVSAARNKGIIEAKYEWISFLDGDDRWKKEYLENIYELILRYSSASVITTGFATVDKSGVIKKKYQLSNEGIIDDYFKLVNTLGRYIMHTSATTAKKKLLLEITGFKENLTHGEDLDLWERLAKKYIIATTPKVLSLYMIDAENRSNFSLPLLEKTRVYNIDFSKLDDTEQIKYYKNGVLSSMKSAIKKRNFKRFYMLLTKHNKYVTFVDFVTYLLK